MVDFFGYFLLRAVASHDLRARNYWRILRKREFESVFPIIEAFLWEGWLNECNLEELPAKAKRVKELGLLYTSYRMCFFNGSFPFVSDGIENEESKEILDELFEFAWEHREEILLLILMLA